MANLSPTAEATRQTFIEIFCDIYKTKSVEKITVTELTQKAGYNRATFYEYFFDIYDLLEQIEDELIDLIGENIKKTISRENFVNIFIEAFIVMQKDTEYPSILMMSEPSSNFPAKLKNELMPVILSALNISADNIKAVYALDFYLSGAISMIIGWQKNDMELSTNELGSLIHTILTEGVLKAIGQLD